jgi:hypothetical protein
MKKNRTKQRVPRNMNFKPDEERRARFMRALDVGHRTQIKQALENLVDAYSEFTETHGAQPDFPLMIVSKTGVHPSTIAPKEKRGTR